ncbi:MAG: ATP-grasp domain-containing protein [Limnochordaceae bacterium]|nr:ATP-grasp domain-containing protein [Limnochordaceae bacterium]
MNILFTSAGRRVSLIRGFRRALASRNEAGRILATDMEATAPTLYEVDRAFIVPRVADPAYVPRLLEICQRESVDVLIPLIDPELPVLARARDQFASGGTTVVISSPDSVAIGDDKLATVRFFEARGIPTARTFVPNEALRDIHFPVIVKPRRGSSGQGVIKCSDQSELYFYLERQKDVIIQEFLSGYEVTIDIFGDGTGRVISFVPRKRLKVRGGEVERAITIDDTTFADFVLKIANGFKPYGPINVQCFVGDSGPVFSEINPRFGGGYPLADAAGAQFPELILDLVAGKTLECRLGKYQRGLVMARYDDAVFMPEDKLIR